MSFKLPESVSCNTMSFKCGEMCAIPPFLYLCLSIGTFLVETISTLTHFPQKGSIRSSEVLAGQQRYMTPCVYNDTRRHSSVHTFKYHHALYLNEQNANEQRASSFKDQQQIQAVYLDRLGSIWFHVYTL